MKPTDFSGHLTNFFTHYLAAQRNLSSNTIKAYRDVFTLLLRFCRDVPGASHRKDCALNRWMFPGWKPFWITWSEKESPQPAPAIIGWRPCTPAWVCSV